MKKLNRKGFTLIELLAVIVILAVVMGIAITSVLSSMNSARGGAIVDTAQIIANAFNQKYTESLVNGAATEVYKGEGGTTFGGYDFTSTKRYYIDPLLVDTFGISANTYNLATKAEIAANATDVENSFVAFDSIRGKFVVCMAAKSTGPNYVTGYSTTAATKLSEVKTASTDTLYNGITVKSGIMMACSDGTKTW